MGRMTMAVGLMLLVAAGCAPEETDGGQTGGADAEATRGTQAEMRAAGGESSAGQAAAGGERTASATLVDRDGAELGTAELVETPNHGVLIRLDVEGLEPGSHGFHIHETGDCTTPDFSAAGGHFAPRDHAHGMFHADGMHAGDMPNLEVPEGGAITAERLAQDVSLRAGSAGYLLDDDGSALMIHAGADDYRSQPSGDAGDRVACGVIR